MDPELQAHLDHMLAFIGQQFDSLNGRFTRLEGRFESLESRFESLESRFESLESRFEAQERTSSDLEAGCLLRVDRDGIVPRRGREGRGRTVIVPP